MIEHHTLRKGACSTSSRAEGMLPRPSDTVDRPFIDLGTSGINSSFYRLTGRPSLGPKLLIGIASASCRRAVSAKTSISAPPIDGSAVSI